jgi:hypothetical protein
MCTPATEDGRVGYLTGEFLMVDFVGNGDVSQI